MPTPFPFRPMLAALLVACTGTASADPDDSFNLYLGLGTQRDSNLFRQPKGAEQSDTLDTTSLTLSLNKPYSLQRIYLDATLIDYRYRENDYLSYQAKNYNAGWNWSLTPRLHGVLSVDRTEVQNSFVDYSASSPEQLKNVRRTENQRFNAEWEAFGGWRALAGISRVSQTNSQTFLEQSSYALTSRELGVKYAWRAGTFLQALRREGEGEYKERRLITFAEVPAPFNSQIDNGFRQNETELRFYVPLTGKSAVTARLGRQERRHDHFPDRDYAATIGRLDYAWQITGQISLAAALRRDVAAYQDFASSYYLADGLTLQPVWQISARAALRLKLDWEERQYRGGIFPGVKERRDTIQSASLAVDWNPARWASLSASLQRDARDSNFAGRDYRATMAMLTAQFNY